jgi:hypothetical protein
MATHTITKRGRFVLSIGASALALILLLSPVGRSYVGSTFDWIVQTVDTVAELPCRIVTNVRHFSLDRLDPTCPQCI